VKPPALTSRVGIGYDSHRYVPGDGVLLGGVRIPATVRCTGHSDADAVCHALTDAILGGAGLGDIGEMFPDTNAENAGRNSVEMLTLAVARTQKAGWTPAQADITVIGEFPKIGPHRAAIREKLAAALGLEPDAVMVKGKTNEGMGWIGRGEGIAVIAVATLLRSTS
jgi:2-C-methyl-D-erythritol 2,4-cyclodiphosphate synthase